MAKLYRFELAFDGEPQGVGFPQGLTDVELWKPVETDLYDCFESLPVPKLAPGLELDEPVSFWFTEEGLSAFDDSINRVADEIAEKNWQLLGMWMEADLTDAIYHDKYQAACAVEYISGIPRQFVPVLDVDEFRQMASG